MIRNTSLDRADRSDATSMAATAKLNAYNARVVVSCACPDVNGRAYNTAYENIAKRHAFCE